MQEGLVDIWKENIMEDLEEGSLEYKVVGEFLADLKKEFSREYEIMKVVKLKKVEQNNRMMEKFV